MAGLGSRFSQEGYALPKPLIPVSSKPMILQAIKHMPPSDKWIFIVRQEHIKEHHIDEIIKREIPSAIIIAISTTTPGQANTCLLAQAYLDPNEPLFIAACDNGYVYDKKNYQDLIADPTIDCIVWTFTHMEKMRTSPHSYGWAKVAEDGKTIIDMSVKVPVSNDPYNDHAVVATFYFKRAQDFIDAVQLMIKEGHRIKNEFYVDAVPIFLHKLSRRSVIFDIDQFICWGTPAELEEYEFWERFFKEKRQVDQPPQDQEKYLFWRKYFTAVTDDL